MVPSEWRGSQVPRVGYSCEVYRSGRRPRLSREITLLFCFIIYVLSEIRGLVIVELFGLPKRKKMCRSTTIGEQLYGNCPGGTGTLGTTGTDGGDDGNSDPPEFFGS